MAKFLWRLAILAAITLTAASLSPLDRVSLGLTAKHHHRAFHWVAFGGLSLLLALLTRTLPQRLLTTTAVISLGALIEYLQHAIYRHPIETLDIRDDTYAALTSLICVYLCSSVAKKAFTKLQKIFSTLFSIT